MITAQYFKMTPPQSRLTLASRSRFTAASSTPRASNPICFNKSSACNNKLWAILTSASAVGGRGDELLEAVVEGSSGRSLEVTCSVRERNSSSYRSNGMEDDILVVAVLLEVCGEDRGGFMSLWRRVCSTLTLHTSSSSKCTYIQEDFVNVTTHLLL